MVFRKWLEYRYKHLAATRGPCGLSFARGMLKLATTRVLIVRFHAIQRAPAGKSAREIRIILYMGTSTTSTQCEFYIHIQCTSNEILGIVCKVRR